MATAVRYVMESMLDLTGLAHAVEPSEAYRILDT
jgi:hypothetical protein